MANEEIHASTGSCVWENRLPDGRTFAAMRYRLLPLLLLLGLMAASCRDTGYL